MHPIPSCARPTPNAQRPTQNPSLVALWTPGIAVCGIHCTNPVLVPRLGPRNIEAVTVGSHLPRLGGIAHQSPCRLSVQVCDSVPLEAHVPVCLWPPFWWYSWPMVLVLGVRGLGFVFAFTSSCRTLLLQSALSFAALHWLMPGRVSQSSIVKSPLLLYTSFQKFLLDI